MTLLNTIILIGLAKIQPNFVLYVNVILYIYIVNDKIIQPFIDTMDVVVC